MEVDGSHYNKEDIFRAMMAYFYDYMYAEEHQVNGAVFIVDLTGYTIKHQTFLTIDDIRKGIKILQVRIFKYLI